jgi:hypothetical protein
VRALSRLCRAGVVAGATVFLAAGAHVAGGGALPDPLIVAAILALVLVPAMALSGRRISAAGMLAMLGSGQFALHGAFEALSGSAPAASQLSPAAGHVHVLGALSAASPAGHVHGESTLMLVAHCIATVLTALVLARGEATLWALLAWLQPLVRLLRAIAFHPVPELPAFAEEPLAPAWRSLRLPARRGPPSSSAVA